MGIGTATGVFVVGALGGAYPIKRAALTKLPA
jgi:hypothetical protein